MQKMTLKALRANSGLSQEKAAKKLGVAAATLSKWENAKSFPDAIEISEIEKLYNTNYNDIIFYLTTRFNRVRLERSKHERIY